MVPAQEGVASTCCSVLDPPVRASHPVCARPRPARGPGNYNSSSISNARKAFCGVAMDWTRRACGWGCCKIAQSHRDVLLQGTVPVPRTVPYHRTAYPYVRLRLHLHNLTSVFGHRAHGATAHLGHWSPRDVPRRSNIYSSSRPPSSCPSSLICFIYFRRIITLSEQLPSTNSINLAAILPIYPLLHLTQ